MTLFLTGASGFVGGAVVDAFKDSMRLRAMSRSAGSDAAIHIRGAEPVRCSLDDVTPAQLSGCDTVVHCAAHVEAWGPWRDYVRVNVEGTRRLLAAAKEAGVRRFIHLGTEAALFHGQHMRELDESAPLALRSPFPYSRTKALSEQLVRAADGDGFTTLVLRPRLIWGPGDQTVLPEVLQMAEAGRFLWIDGGRAMTSTTLIGNLVHAIGLALSKGRGGEAYFITDGAPVQFRAFLERLTACAGVTLPRTSVPGWMLRPLSFATEAVWRALGIASPPPLPPRFVANILSRDCTLKTDKAARELGYAPRYSREDGFTQVQAEYHRL